MLTPKVTAFEEWAKDSCSDLDLDKATNLDEIEPGPHYTDYETIVAWNAWCAALEWKKK